MVFNIVVRYRCKRKTLKTNWYWKTISFFVTFLSLVKFQLGGRPAWLSLCSNCGKQKRYLQIFREVSGDFQQNFNNSKNSAVLEPRTGQFSRTYGFEAKAQNSRLRGQGQGIKMCPRGLHLCWELQSIKLTRPGHNAVLLQSYLLEVDLSKQRHESTSERRALYIVSGHVLRCKLPVRTLS